MKHFYTLLLVLCVTIGYAQKKKNILSKFNTEGMSTSILYQKSPIIDIDTYNSNTVNAYSFFQAFKAISQSDIQHRLKSISTLKSEVKEAQLNNTVPLSILHSNYETIASSAFENNSITNDTEGYLIRQNNVAVFEVNHLTVASPLLTEHKGLRVNFNLTDIYNTTTNTIDNIAINFDDGTGYRNITTNEAILVNYPNDGKKILDFKITLNTGEILNRTSYLKIKYSNEDLNTLFNRDITTIQSYTTPDLSVYNEAVSYPGQGEYDVFLSADNILDKPIFVVDGFDPGDSRDITGLYDLLNFDDNGNTSNLGDLVRAEGFDIVILNFPVYQRAADNTMVDGGVDFIERNAMILVNLINTINAQKVGDAENVVIGPSMGGLISRYALSYMEQQNLNHDTRLWISFDSPHHGANVPIGFQHQFNFLAYGLNDFFFIGDQNVEELQPIINGMLKSSAARQMLTDQLEAHLVSNDPEEVEFSTSLELPQSHPFKTTFYNRLNSLTTSGFPETLRKVSIINGSGINSRYPNNSTPSSGLLPNGEILNTTFNVTIGTDATLRTHFTPSAGQNEEASYVYIDFAWYIPAFDVSSYANAEAYSYSDGIDAASGGLFDVLGLTEDLDTTGLVGNFLNALQTDYFNFIPSVSAMAFEISNNELDWFYTPNNVTTGRATTNITPFDNWHMPDTNEPHVTLTQDNVDFALDEILQPTFSNDEELLLNIKLEKNPISDSITLISSTEESAVISITDTLGKLVTTSEIELSERTEIPVNLSSGIYLLKVTGENNKTFSTKLIVK